MAHIDTGEGPRDAVIFSVVTLVASDAKYDRLRASFAAQGFDASNTQFIAIDNRMGNQADGYSALTHVAQDLAGRYVLLTHDDVELTGDGFAQLLDLVEDLDARDPTWMLAGNAGAAANLQLLRHIDDPNMRARLEGGPQEVASLDENFLVMPRARIPFPSIGIGGFHLFGTDMCLQAQSRGGRAYVVPFLLTHHSGGDLSPAFFAASERFEAAWSAKGKQGMLRTPSTYLYFGWQGRVLRLVHKGLRFAKRLVAARPSQHTAQHTTQYWAT